jgi:hypothetical protein
VLTGDASCFGHDRRVLAEPAEFSAAVPDEAAIASARRRYLVATQWAHTHDC